MTGQQRAAQGSQLFSGVSAAACRQSQCGGGDRPDHSCSSTSSCKRLGTSISCLRINENKDIDTEAYGDPKNIKNKWS